MPDWAPFHISKFTRVFFETKRFTKEKMIEWLSSYLDLNLTENLWSIVKRKLYENGKQYNSKTDLWKAIKSNMSKIEPVKVNKKITKSMNNKLLAVIEKKGHYIKM